MSKRLIESDVKLMRLRYDEALEMQGIEAKYQYPNISDPNGLGETIIDSYSDMVDTYVFFDGSPKIKTLKRFGWVVDNDSDLPFLIHCSFQLPHLQKDCLFRLSGHYSEVPDRTFKVTEISYDPEAPDHLVCQIVPVYDDKPTGRTRKEEQKTFNTSHHFLSDNTDYRGDYHKTKEDVE